MKVVEGYPGMSGFLRIMLFNPETGEIRKMIEKKNLILYSGADVAAKCLVGQSDYRVRTMYMEFENTATPGSISEPTFDRTADLSYYTSLAAPKDFLRVPLLSNPDISASSTSYDGNQITFFGVSEALVGFQNGLPFGHDVDSAIYGAALVASPDYDTQSQDVLFSRAYFFDDGGPVVKAENFQIGVQWTIRFE